MNTTETMAGQVEATLATIKRAANKDATSVGDLLHAFGRRAYGPVFFLLGLVALSPLGAIPGASIVCATLVALLALQMSLRCGPPWIPSRLRAIKVDGIRARRAVEWIEPQARKLAVLTRPRWETLLDGRAIHAAVGALCLLAAAMYPLALVPWGVVPCAAGITSIGLGLLSRDGAFILAGILFAVPAAGIGLAFTVA